MLKAESVYEQMLVEQWTPSPGARGELTLTLSTGAGISWRGRHAPIASGPMEGLLAMPHVRRPCNAAVSA